MTTGSSELRSPDWPPARTLQSMPGRTAENLAGFLALGAGVRTESSDGETLEAKVVRRVVDSLVGPDFADSTVIPDTIPGGALMDESTRQQFAGDYAAAQLEIARRVAEKFGMVLAPGVHDGQ